MTQNLKKTFIWILSILFFCSTAHASIKQQLQNDAQLLKPLASKTNLLKAIQSANLKNKPLTALQIRHLKSAWRSQKKSGRHPMATALQSNDLAKVLLNYQKQHEPVFSSVSVTDGRGIYVAQTATTKDWQQAYAKRALKKGFNKIHFSRAYTNPANQQKTIRITLPIRYQNTTVGTLNATVLKKDLMKRSQKT